MSDTDALGLLDESAQLGIDLIALRHRVEDVAKYCEILNATADHLFSAISFPVTDRPGLLTPAIIGRGGKEEPGIVFVHDDYVVVAWSAGRFNVKFFTETLARAAIRQVSVHMEPPLPKGCPTVAIETDEQWVLSWVSPDAGGFPHLGELVGPLIDGSAAFRRDADGRVTGVTFDADDRNWDPWDRYGGAIERAAALVGDADKYVGHVREHPERLAALDRQLEDAGQPEFLIPLWIKGARGRETCPGWACVFPDCVVIAWQQISLRQGTIDHTVRVSAGSIGNARVELVPGKRKNVNMSVLSIPATETTAPARVDFYHNYGGGEEALLETVAARLRTR
jgi:hypothetical protein